jgi:phosphoserine aminotransferase
MKKIYFTPGPTELYHTVPDHLKQALKDDILSISHRSKAFEHIYSKTVENLKALLNIPEDFTIFFTSSSTETMERIIMNLVGSYSFHIVNGAFSNRFYQVANQLGKKARKLETASGQSPNLKNLLISDTFDLIAITQNETSQGIAFPLDEIYQIKSAFPEKLLVVDAVSALPYVAFDYKNVDSVFFSVQHGFGLPAGLAVWLVNQCCIEKAQLNIKNDKAFQGYHSVERYYMKALKNQTPETPNILGIYLLSKVTEDMLLKGIHQIRRETEYKAALLYHTLENHPKLKCFVNEPRYRSKTIIAAETVMPSNEIISYFATKGMILGAGYDKYKFKHVRIANYPAHSKEQIEILTDYLNAW